MQNYLTSYRYLFVVLLGALLEIGYDEQQAGLSSLAKAQTIPSHNPPTLLAISPNKAHNHQEVQVALTGTNFVAIPRVRVNDVPLLHVTYVNATRLTATMPSNLPGGVYTVTVTNPDNQSASLSNAFTSLYSGDCTIESWQKMTSMSSSRAEFAVVQAGNYFYALGGRQNQFAPSPLNSIERAAINPDHTLGSWQIIGSLSSPRSGHEAIVVGDYLYVLGGYDINSKQNNVERARIYSDGTIGSWVVEESMVTHRYGFAVVRAGSRLYALGGVENSDQNNVETTIVNPDGSLGPWHLTRSLPSTRNDIAAFTLGNLIYVVGGQGDIFYDTIERTSVDPGGALSAWQSMRPMTKPGYSLAAVPARGCLYLMGGVRQGDPGTQVEQTMIDATGALGNWRSVAPMVTERANQEALVFDGHIFVFGGRNSTGRYLDEVERANIIVDITPPVINNFVVNGAALSTASTSVRLAIFATDVGLGLYEMRFSHDDSIWSDWQTFSSLVAWELSTGDGVKVVYAQFRDPANNLSLVVSDTITLATTAPANHGLTINNGALFTNKTAVSLTIGANIGTARMIISNNGGFSGAIWEPYTAQKVWEITAFGNYVIPRVVYVRYEDVTGNVSATYQDDIILDVTPPSGSVNVAEAATATATNSVITLVLAATDDVSGVGGMMISNRSDFVEADWQSFQATYQWLLDNNNTVYVRFRDNAGNSSDIYTASVIEATPTSTATPIPTQTPIPTLTTPAIRVYIPLVSR